MFIKGKCTLFFEAVVNFFDIYACTRIYYNLWNNQ